MAAEALGSGRRERSEGFRFELRVEKVAVKSVSVVCCGLSVGCVHRGGRACGPVVGGSVEPSERQWDWRFGWPLSDTTFFRLNQ